MNGEKRFLFFIDALRYDLISPEHAPFLYTLMESGKAAPVIPSFGFEPDRAIFLGVEPEVYNGGMHFQFRKNPQDIFRKLRWIDRMPGRRVWRKAFQYGLRSLSRNERLRRTATLAEIPFELYGYFEAAEKEMPLEYSPVQGKRSVLALMQTEGRFDYWGFPYQKIDIAHPQYYVKQFREQHLDAVLLYIHQLDGVAHRYGPESSEAKAMFRRIDQFVRDVVEAFRGEPVIICIFGDHGMAPVKEHHDLFSLINKLPLKLHTDYVYFLDSVFARFWVFNPHARETVLDFLSSITCGSIITSEETEHYHIRYEDNRFGDIIFWAGDYIEFFPSFWNISMPSKGMHGYRETCPENHTLFILYPNDISPSLELKNPSRSLDLYEYLLSSCAGRVYAKTVGKAFRENE